MMVVSKVKSRFNVDLMKVGRSQVKSRRLSARLACDSSLGAPANPFTSKHGEILHVKLSLT